MRVKNNNCSFYMFLWSEFIDIISDILLYNLAAISIISSHVIGESSIRLFIKV